MSVSRRIFALLAVLLLLLVVTPACAQESEPSPEPAPPTDLFQHLDPQWVQNEYWYRGEAEIDLYDASLVKYGEPREVDEVAMIFVTEDFEPDLLVKADDWQRPDLVPMFKLNYVISVQTGVYRYEQMLSFFFRRADLGLTKMTLSSHEWCGNSFKELINHGERESFDFNTYWDGQGNGEYGVDFPDDLVLYDSLPAQLRALRFEEGLEATMHLLPTQLSSRVSPPAWETATLRVLPKTKVEVPAGTFEAWPVEVFHARGTDRLAFEAAYPNRMVRWHQAGGDRYELETSETMAYWNLNGKDDEGKLRGD